MRNSDFGNARGGRPALDELSHTDLLLDALAARTEDDFADPGDLDDQALAALLGNWRDDLRWPPASALVSQDEAEEALRDGMLDRRHGRRGLAAVGSVAATLLALSGFGAVVADAKPGDPLYGLHAMIFNEPRVGDDQIVLSAKADLAKVEQMIAQGQWDQAQTQLAEVSSTLQGVNDGSRRQGLLAEVNQLNTVVEHREPKAATASAPSVTSSVAPTTSPRTPAGTTSPAPSPSSSPALTTSPKPSATPPPSQTDSPTPSSKTRHRHRKTPSETPSSAAAPTAPNPSG